MMCLCLPWGTRRHREVAYNRPKKKGWVEIVFSAGWTMHRVSRGAITGLGARIPRYVQVCAAASCSGLPVYYWVDAGWTRTPDTNSYRWTHNDRVHMHGVDARRLGECEGGGLQPLKNGNFWV